MENWYNIILVLKCSENVTRFMAQKASYDIESAIL